ncbi:MAG TPA: hypothetical protein VIY52_07090, partial [Streptosporangiaceae bacterium]
GTGYVMAVRSNYPVTLPSGRSLTVKNAAKLAGPAAWQRMRTGSATKGTKDYHWAMIQVRPDDTPEGQDDGHAVLLLRRHRYTGTVSYFLCWTGHPVPLARLIAVAVTRWKIEPRHDSRCGPQHGGEGDGRGVVRRPDSNDGNRPCAQGSASVSRSGLRIWWSAVRGRRRGGRPRIPGRRSASAW